MRPRIDGWGVLVAALFIAGGARAASAQDKPLLVSGNYDVAYHEFTETTVVGGHVDVAKVFGLLAGEHIAEQAGQQAGHGLEMGPT